VPSEPGPFEDDRENSDAALASAFEEMRQLFVRDELRCHEIGTDEPDRDDDTLPASMVVSDQISSG